ncbi:hypothetical protein EJD97_015409, partial [Solanum chilense]
VEETPIEEDHNVDQGQQYMFNDEFHPADMNNPDDEIGIGEGEGKGEGGGEDEAQTKGSDLESKFPPTPIVCNNNPCASQTSHVINVRDDEKGFYRGMTFKNKQERTNSLKIACLKKNLDWKRASNE